MFTTPPYYASDILRQRKETQKALASSEGSAFVAITQPAAGKHVFLRATSAITTVMLSMTSEDAKEQKAAYGRKKKVRLTPVKKQQLWRSPSLALHKGK